MTDIVGRLLDEAEKAQRKGHLVLAEVCRDASDQLGLITEERNRLLKLLPEAHAAMRACGWHQAMEDEPISDGVLEAACTEIEAAFAAMLGEKKEGGG